MNKNIAAFSDVLFEQVKGFDRLNATDFEALFETDVADLDETLVATDWRIVPDVGEIVVLSIGYAVFVDRANRYTLFETEAHYNERVLRSSWASFVRGCWSDRTPTEPGLYFARDRDMGRRSVRELRRVNGRLLDVSGGAVPWGRVSVWEGQWWSIPVPALPNSY